jgi:hypothetical protein
MADTAGLSRADLQVLRGLGEWKAIASTSAENRERIQAWLDHDAGIPDSRVMVICETSHVYGRPVDESDCRCVDPWARRLELELRQMKWEFERLRDDHVVQPWIEYSPKMRISDLGVPSGKHRDAGADSFAFNYQPPLKTLDEADFARLHHRELHWLEDEEERERERLEAVFAGILPVRRRWWTWLPLTSTCFDLVGEDGFMFLIYDNPEGLHRLMSFLRDDLFAFLAFLEDNELLELNNEGDYTGVGLMGCTKRLPAPDFAGKVRTKDLWLNFEAQETVCISPEHFGEFVFPYFRSIAERFGGIYYGCCEPVDPILSYLDTLPNLQRLSVSYWANEPKVAQFCRRKGVVYSRKSGPSFFIGDTFDEGVVRSYLEKTVESARGCRLELNQRDALSCNDEPERFIRWVELAREVGSTHMNEARERHLHDPT